MDERFGAWAARWRVPLGFLLGLAFLILSQPTKPALVAGSVVVLAGILLRAYAAGHLEKDRALTTCGPYRWTRNPLYLGSLFIGAGFALASCSWILAVGFAVLFLAVYWPVMRREENHLRRSFPEAYNRYAETVPLLVPAPWRARPPAGERFRWERYRKNREYEAALGFLAGVGFLILKMWLR